jgi:hypothetical protein
MAVKNDGMLLTIENSTGITLPSVDDIGGHRTMVSLGTDHSKWAVLVPRGQLGSIPSLFCTCDLNRTYKQEERGGAALCQSDSLFVELISGLQPTVSNAFLNKNIPFERLEHLYEGMNRGSKVSLLTFEFDAEGRCPALFLGFPRTDGAYAAYKLPNPYGIGVAGAMAPDGVAEILGDRLPEQPPGFINLDDLF